MPEITAAGSSGAAAIFSIGTLSLMRFFAGIKHRPGPGNVSSVLLNRRKGQEMEFRREEFGQRIKALRKENGLTLQQMADELNISYQHYKKIENGSHGCSIEVLLDISSVFDVSTDYLLTGRTFEPLRIQKQLSEAQDILSDIMKDLNQASDYRM